jgi:hypothetical protein
MNGLIDPQISTHSHNQLTDTVTTAQDLAIAYS